MKQRFFRVFALLLSFVFLTACSSRDDSRPKEGMGTATLRAVGDIFLSPEMLTDARSGNGSYDFRPTFEQVFTVLSDADVTIGNFEGTFAGGGEGSYPDALAGILAAAGLDILQTANSYSVQHGLSGLQRTRDVILEQGLIPLGTYSSAEEREDAPVYVREINGIRFAFVAFTKGFQGMGLPAGSEHCVNLLYSDYTTDYEDINREEILDILEAAQDTKPDFIVAALHWGSENIGGISSSQERITDLLLQNGVDVILGSHSHRLEQVETRQVTMEDDTVKTCVIAYNLGDFCYTEAGKCNTSVVLDLEFTRNHATGEGEISAVSYVPVSTVDNGESYANRFAVVPTDEAIALYEGNYYLRVSEAAYNAMVKGREGLEEKLFPQPEEEATE